MIRQYIFQRISVCVEQDAPDFIKLWLKTQLAKETGSTF
jgi:hypothetical protein